MNSSTNTLAWYQAQAAEAQRQTPLQRVMETYDCDAEVAQRYLDLRAEGYNYVQAQLMAGIGDPT